MVSDSLKPELQEAASPLAESLTLQLWSLARQQVFSTLNYLSSSEKHFKIQAEAGPLLKGL